MEPSNTNSPYPNTQPPAAVQSGGPKNNKKILFIAGVIVVLLVILVMMLFTGKDQEKDSSSKEDKSKGTQLTIGNIPYVYGCSVVTLEDFKTSFGFSGPDTIGDQSSTTALLAANDGAETDLTKAAPQSKSSDYSSDCRLTLTPTANATRPVSITTEVRQYTEERYAKNFLEGQRRFAVPGGSTDTSNLPKLSAFADSFVKMPSPGGATHTITAIVQQGSHVFRIEYMMNDNETAETTLPKIDTFMKAITAKAADKNIATRATLLDGHATMINRPFIETCGNVGLVEVGKELGGLNFRVDEVTSTNQFGALTGSSAEGDGVASSCSLAFNTSAERSKTSDTSSASSTPDLKKQYPHTLVLRTNRYASSAVSQLAFNAYKARQAQTGSTVAALDGIADSGYKVSKQTEIPDFSIKGDNKRTFVQDSYILLKGDTIITIATQQSQSSATSPTTVTNDQVKKVYQRMQAMLAK